MWLRSPPLLCRMTLVHSAVVPPTAHWACRWDVLACVAVPLLARWVSAVLTLGRMASPLSPTAILCLALLRVLSSCQLLRVLCRLPPSRGSTFFRVSSRTTGLLAATSFLVSPVGWCIFLNTGCFYRMHLCAPPYDWGLFGLFWSSWFCGGGCLIFTLSSVLPPPHLQFSAYPPTQCPSFGEHDAHFVGEPHDIGSVLPSYVWKV